MVEIPAGMKPYGPDHPDYPNAPSDWDGGGLLFRDRSLAGDSPGVFGRWKWTEDGDGTIIAYTPRSGAAPADGVEPFLDQLRRVNLERYEAWVEGADAGIMFDALELGGEVGELLNVVKKLEREERGWRGSRASNADFADECADVLICLDKLARRRGVDLEAATIAKFNATSDKQGFSHHLAATSSARPAASDEVVRAARVVIADAEEWGILDDVLGDTLAMRKVPLIALRAALAGSGGEGVADPPR